MTSIAITHETKAAPAGNLLVKHPDNIKSGAWQRITVANLQSGQSRRYADTVYEADIAIEGGCRSNMSGFDLPFGTGSNEDRVKEIARVMVAPWSDNPGPFGARLTEIKQIERTETYAIWHVVIVQPYCD